MSRKSERLVNLTIALLATKRYLTKDEIFRSIEGYEGNTESKERMFEHDKVDVRSLGIEIEVGGLDPLFNDEAGYRIKAEAYKLDLGSLTGTDVALLSLAADAWKGAALNFAANSALVKLKSMGIDSDIESIPTLAPQMAWSGQELETVLEAIAQGKRIVFTYYSADLEKQSREVHPYAVATREGHWYFAGLDLEKNAVRTFRFDRIDGEISLTGKEKSYKIPDGFDLLESLEIDKKYTTAVLDIRKDRAFSLRKSGTIIEDLGEWERVRVDYFDTKSFSDAVLWHLDDVVVIEPVELRKTIIEILKDLAVIHG